MIPALGQQVACHVIAMRPVGAGCDHDLALTPAGLVIRDQGPVIEVIVSRAESDCGHLDLIKFSNECILHLEVVIAAIAEHRQVDILY